MWYAENEIGKPAAIKILNENLSHNQQIVERFHNEALVMVKLNHPNIRQVYGYGYLGERHCIIMEYLEGEDLEELMKNGRRFTEEELRRWWNQTVDALNYTHAMGIVHRDIKPSNIFLDEMGNIKLLDFGIAKMMENASLTQTGMVMGTPMYMSPEQVNDIKHVDYHTDLYSLAVSFVHMLTGKKPYDDTNCSVFEIQMSIVTKPLDLSEVPEAWRDFLTPYLAKAAAQRPQLKHFESVLVVEEPTPIVEKNEPTVVEQVKPSTMTKTEESTLVKEVSKPDAEPEAKPEVKPAPKPLHRTLEANIVDVKARTSHNDSSSRENETLSSNLDDISIDDIQSKKGLWIGIGVVALVAVLLVLIIKSKKEFLSQDVIILEEAILQEEPAFDPETLISGKYNGHDYVDLGLPSGTLWATCNVGATTPEGYGDYFAWGETTPKTSYDWNNYKYAKGESDKLTKCCSKSDYGYKGYKDFLYILEFIDDAARANWGTDWRMPTRIEWEELKDNTTCKQMIQNGVKGMLFTAFNNDKCLFLPAAGYCYESDVNYVGSQANYWSSSLYTDSPNLAKYFYIDYDESWERGMSMTDRNLGLSVRAVCSKLQD